MTKDELIDQHFSPEYLNGEGKWMVTTLNDLMDEYAKQEAVEFAEWLEDNRANEDMAAQHTHTSEQLYSLFKQTHQ